MLALVMLWVGCDSTTNGIQADGSSPKEAGAQDRGAVDTGTADQKATDGKAITPEGSVQDTGADSAPPSCTDQCAWGHTRVQGSTKQTCTLYSETKKAFIPLSSGMHDRARRYNAWLRSFHLPGGTVSDSRFADTTYKTVTSFHGTGDSAIWTGSYLAAEALRLKVSNSPDAKQNVQQIVEAIHRLFAITGDRAYMARHAAPLNSGDKRLDALYDAQKSTHHKTKYQGKDYYWSGGTSRDQYQGMLLGYSLAYDALSSAAHKKMIRDDMVALCEELMKAHKVTVRIKFHVLGKWQTIPVPLTMEGVVLAPSEYVQGGPFIQLGTTAKPTAYEDSEMVGMREFFPDYSALIKQIPILGPLIGGIPVPRADSAVMLANIFRIGLQMTKGEAAYAAQYAAINTYYQKNRAKWLGLMKQYIFLNGANTCWKSYYGLNILFEPLYNLIRLEDHAATKDSIQKDLLEKKIWPIVKDHKNVFFSYIYASQGPPATNKTAVVASAKAQLAQFPPPPHALKTVNLKGKYPTHSTCTDQSTVAVDVKDRVGDDFIWQREPFKLVEIADGRLVYPGVDYMLAYWMGRRHGFETDDAPGTCLKWKP